MNTRTNPWAAWTTEGIFSGHGGVQTEEGDVLQGELTVHTTWSSGQAGITVRYVGAEDWYTLQGSPLPAGDEETARSLHRAAVKTVQRGRGA
ncbi:hypothetical protein [Streptacidiphilus anmyonensis]|uniref:hypothetical protein n=1 Tax=Streptacidiphilus anmyonensis TaxID=405782 RepID=UPI0005A960D2|nr:hypothetical protein [Streptacidiphilus anmyonensis]